MNHRDTQADPEARHRDFYRVVQKVGRLRTLEEAQAVTRHVFSSLATGLDQRLVSELERCLPARVAADLAAERRRSPAAPAEGFDRQQFVGPLVNTMDSVGMYDQTLGGMDLVSAYLDDDAARRVQGVFAATRVFCEPHLAAELVAALPPEIRDWFRDARAGTT